MKAIFKKNEKCTPILLIIIKDKTEIMQQLRPFASACICELDRVQICLRKQNPKISWYTLSAIGGKIPKV